MRSIKKNTIFRNTFSITYTLLFATAIITFIEAIRTPDPQIRHILNLETCISSVACYFYGEFINKIDTNNIDWKDISVTRYIDWAITTPIMLLALCLVLSKNTNTVIHFKTIFLIIILNYLMLLMGYLGEINIINRYNAMFLGFIPFILMFYIIYVNYIKPVYVYANYIIYGIYLIVWGLYGVVYLFGEENKNILTNILDLIAKCFVGLGLWIYYTKIVRL
jgi:bacteriorhodopsin